MWGRSVQLHSSKTVTDSITCVICCCKLNNTQDWDEHLFRKVSTRYCVAHMCTCEDGLAYISGAPSMDDVMSYNLLTTRVKITFIFIGELFYVGPPKESFFFDHCRYPLAHFAG